MTNGQLPQLVNLPRAREIMAREKVDGLIARVPLNVYYLSGYWGLLMSAERFDAAFFAVLPADENQPAALVLPSMELRRLVAHGGSWIPETFIFTRPDDEQDHIAVEGLPYGGWPIRDGVALTDLEEQGIAATKAQVGRVSGNARGALARAVKVAGLERGNVVSDDVRVAGWLESAGLTHMRCREDANIFNEIRLIKTEAELALMRKAATINEAAARHAAAAFRDGADWLEIEAVYATAMAAAGARPGYLMCGAGGPRSGRLQTGEPMFIDALGTYQQYHGDFGRCVVIGEADDETRRRHSALLAGWDAVAGMLRPGTRYSELADAVTAAVRKAGLPEFVYATPHSLGLEHTDDPKTVGSQQGSGADTVLQENMVLNIDMPFTEIGWGSVHIEDTVRITADGFETLTSNDLNIIEVPTSGKTTAFVATMFAMTSMLFPQQQAEAEVAPYGSWDSPHSAADIFAGTDYVSELFADGDQLYFIEKRASANGRNVLVRLDKDNKVEQLTDPAISVRSRVHEYGGRPFVAAGDDVYYSQFDDQKIYRRNASGELQAITSDGLRYMECVVDRRHQQLICVREDHRNDGEPVNTLAAISLVDGSETVLFEGTDFVETPELSPDEKSVAFVTWSHPNMRWDDTQIRVVTLEEDGSARSVYEVPQRGGVSLKEPKFSNDGTLYFIADFDNWWTLYRLGADGQPEAVLDQEIEMESYGFESDAAAIVTYLRDGLAYVGRVELATGDLTDVGGPLSSADSVVVASDGVYFRGAAHDSQESIYRVVGNEFEKIYEPAGPRIAAEHLSEPMYFSFPTGDGEEAYGFFYPPKNAAYQGEAGSLPPLIVEVHGGPVGKTTSKLEPEIQFWTSRGFAVFDVNHRGSTGYGRAFRKRLYPNWGIVDLEDAASGVQWLANQGYIDPDRVAIRGGSAGGYTTLGAMAFMDTFKAGASYYGVSDLEILAKETHKYESRYLDQLIGPYPENKKVYLERSPIYSIDKIQEPLLLLQGLDDEVVPPNQSQMIFDALVANCVPTAYIAFEGEGHGFRQPQNKIRALNAELDFYGQVFGFTPAGDIERVPLATCSE